MKNDNQKPVYEKPKVYRLDDSKSALGGGCQEGSGAFDGCTDGNLAQEICLAGADGASPTIPIIGPE